MNCEDVYLLVHNAKEEDLLKSCFHCHAKHVHSIVLKTDIRDGHEYLTRLYLTMPGHKLLNGINTIGAHNHRYDIEITGIYNKNYIYNTIYRDRRSYDLSKYYTIYSINNIHKTYEIKTQFCKKPPIIKHIGYAELAVVFEDNLLNSIYLGADTIHSMKVYKDYTGWLVEEQVHKNDTTYLYQNNDIDTTYLYQKPISKQEVIDLFETFLTGYKTTTPLKCN